MVPLVLPQSGTPHGKPVPDALRRKDEGAGARSNDVWRCPEKEMMQKEETGQPTSPVAPETDSAKKPGAGAPDLSMHTPIV